MTRRKKPTAVRPQASLAPIGTTLATPMRVFISYRRDDTAAFTAHLHYSLEQRLGANKIFRDLDTIQPGQNFETIIDDAIRSASVCLVVIGPSWLDIRGSDGQRRLESRGDYVRTEIELALRAGIEVIPLLVDGAKMPDKNKLPESISGLAVRNAYELPWLSGISKLASRIEQVDRQHQAREAEERAERERLDLTGGQPVSPGTFGSQSAIVTINVIVRTMEISLARQGHKVWLSAADLVKSYGILTNRSPEQGFVIPDVVHIIDFVEVKAKKSNRRYVARSYPIDTFAEVPRQLALGRPVLVEVRVPHSWFHSPIRDTGQVSFNAKDRTFGKTMAAVLGWDSVKQIATLLFPWSSWGNRGMATFTRQAVDAYLISDGMRSIEAVLMKGLFPQKRLPRLS